MRHVTCLVICGLVLGAPTSASAQTSEEITVIRRIFAKVQPLSILYNREYCGYIGVDAEGRLRASRPVPGDSSTCQPRDPTELVDIVASYHTHAAYARNYYNEVPSQDDVEGDADQGMDGYVATPGGRLWHIDGDTMVVSQICPVNCLHADPDFSVTDGGAVAKTYSYDELLEKLNK